MSERERARIDVDRPRCPFCHADVGPDDAKTACEACMAWHHRGCWAEHGRCSGCGASHAAGAAPVATAPPRPAPAASAGELARPSPASHHDSSQRSAGWFLLVVGGSNVLLFGALFVWSVVVGRASLDFTALCVTFFALGLGLAGWATRLLGATRPRPWRTRDGKSRA